MFNIDKMKMIKSSAYRDMLNNLDEHLLSLHAVFVNYKSAEDVCQPAFELAREGLLIAKAREIVSKRQ